MQKRERTQTDQITSLRKAVRSAENELETFQESTQESEDEISRLMKLNSSLETRLKNYEQTLQKIKIHFESSSDGKVDIDESLFDVPASEDNARKCVSQNSSPGKNNLVVKT